jgi:hypothetical protein
MLKTAIMSNFAPNLTGKDHNNTASTRNKFSKKNRTKRFSKAFRYKNGHTKKNFSGELP